MTDTRSQWKDLLVTVGLFTAVGAYLKYREWFPPEPPHRPTAWDHVLRNAK